MELSCTQVPLYGQVAVLAKFDDNIYLPEDAEFYFIYNGSARRHIVFAQRVGDNTLQSIVPGHGSQETVSATVCMYTMGYSPVTVGCGSVTYAQDTACMLSNYLVGHAGLLDSESHRTVLDRFGLTEQALRAIDRQVMLAMSYTDLPAPWNSGEETIPKESLLHLSMRWGLVKLSKFLVASPGGTLALASPNEEGATPLDLASRNGHTKLVEIFSNFQEVPALEFSAAVIGPSAALRLDQTSGALTLTVKHATEYSLEDDVKLFRKCLWDENFRIKVLNLKNGGREVVLQMHSYASETEEDSVTLKSRSSSTEPEDVECFQDSLARQSDGESQAASGREKKHCSLDVLKKYKHPPTFLAAASLSAMMNGHDEVYANYMAVKQDADSDMNYIHIDCVTEDASCTDLTDAASPSESCVCPSLRDSTHIMNVHAEHHQTLSRNGESAASTLDQCAAEQQHPPFRARAFKFERNPAYSSIKKRSSSLDGLDADSEGESISERPHSTFAAVALNAQPVASSGDELDSFEINTELDQNIHRTESSSLLPKESLMSGIRLRSYSCSSPKPFQGKPCATRDVAVCDILEDGAFLSNGRSLLQALSLSKSVSLLHPSKQRAYSLPEQLKQKRIEEEEWDKYMTPAKSESEKYRVSRTLSFLKNRMSSTRNKSKPKTKDAKEKEKSNRHQFVAGTHSGVVPCLVCEKALLGKESFQCSYCSLNVHKGCKDSAPVCTKKNKEKNQTKARPTAVTTNPSFSEVTQPPIASSIQSSTSLPINLSGVRQETTLPVSKSVPIAIFERRSLEPEVDPNTYRPRSQSEELLQVVGTPPSVDTFQIEDVVDAPFLGDLSIDPVEFEAESWSLVVDPSFCNKLEKDVIKRQDVIFELMQTELHHIQTLFIMSEIFRKGMKEELQLDHSTVDKIFPCLDELLEIHKEFFSNMKERRQESSEETDRNFVINRIGDILIQQFSEENANKMKQIYGEFCSHHKEAVNIFKELQQNKKFQNFIRLRNSNLLARRRGIPECILLVTQRITKYPVLVERILRYTKDGTEEHSDLGKALCLVKNMIAAVDLRVNEFEKEQKLVEIFNRIENKTCTKLKNGNTFRKQDLTSKERTLLHEGIVFWKTATGRLKDISALLLNDVLLFLQEKDQKFIFAAVDQKPPVICLQKLIVREVANEERGMFLISASSAGPEMYEIRTNSKEERNTWMRHIQEAVQSCPEEEEGNKCESDEDKRVAEARTAKIQRFQELLSNQDQQICGFLDDKLHIYAELAGMSAGEDIHLEHNLLVKPDTGEIPQASSLLNAALREAENLHIAVTSQMDNTISSLEESSETSTSSHRFTSFESVEEILDLSSESLNTEVKEGGTSDFDLSVCQIQGEMEDSYLVDKVDLARCTGITQAEIVQAIQNLTRLLYSIQAAVTIQDSHIEIHKVVLQERERTARGTMSRGNLLQEQEKYRNLEKHREEAANLHKLQHQFNQEQQRWHRECEQRLREQEQKEIRLQEREIECQSQEEQLLKSREELSHQLQDYQQNLERLKEGQRLVEKEKEKLHVQQKLLRHLKHTRQSSLPVMFPPFKSEVVSHARTASVRGEDSLCIEEALVHMSLNSLSNTSPPPMSPCPANEHFHSKNDLTRTCVNHADLSVNNSHHSSTTIEHRCSLSLHHPTAEHQPHLYKGNSPCKNGSSSEELSCHNYHQRENVNCKSPSPRHQDLNALQVIFRGAILAGTYSSNTGNLQTHPALEALPNPQSDVPKDVENGTVEENIVYL
ncbi:rho guanine nucleotide exchange factor 28 isoform X2 [Ambystoma mexicanum]|uniref:rho guanine nucleotide exchange factor 28 isoform X2 n=1 Tax=Ambystoma mexicanum TaxID=8296 RepID=UPI0037E7B97C